jgi:Amt family ammonium transporter
MVFVGAAMLWVGWFGFNAGSQLTASGAAGMTLLVTHLSACSAALVWCLLERLRNGKVGLIGLVTGLVAGLATITPASGDVGPAGAILIGSMAAVACYFTVSLIRKSCISTIRSMCLRYTGWVAYSARCWWRFSANPGLAGWAR